MHQHDLLILGAGWTSTFLIPLCQARRVSFAATTRDGRKVAGADTIPWSFNPDEATTTTSPTNQFSRLPLAAAILIAFPLTGTGQSKKIVDGYRAAHGAKADTTVFIQFGSSGIWQIPQRTIWVSRRSPYNTDSPRAVAEDELLRLGGCVLNLAGLWGGERQPKNWVGRVAKSKEDVKGKKSLHMIHGHDVARAVLAVLKQWDTAKGQRWMLTDGFVYDWWALMSGWADVKAQQGEEVHDEEPSDQAKWVYELMDEEKVWALPRSMEALGRCYFGREFWDYFGLVPLKARI
ncbi:hypothetical protein KC332_g8751 [Hortaea werneckii]|nr:hypothetical protein KC358_g10153 [Hortaea werneckii]OTA25544.1 hypothetical protein BTJ68_11312 [Hortaea werneckii EXF-2000]KAI6824010.1 hypothetical protein KC350_g9106 [Hortaea werneckii]KAI6929312.1 hypothetical protein KC341_g10965 [Hortaea werneckii]KAI6946126.1 hypothetical protein KC348_g3341 [Hortaea werneckii]